MAETVQPRPPCDDPEAPWAEFLAFDERGNLLIKNKHLFDCLCRALEERGPGSERCRAGTHKNPGGFSRSFRIYKVEEDDGSRETNMMCPC
jgi:hypothetical protein